MAQLSAVEEFAKDFSQARGAAPPSLAEAAAYCRQLARRHYENFTVASWLLPRHLRSHFHAIYAYCRSADDLADETGDPRASLAALDWWEEQLDRCYAGSPQHPVFVALRLTIDEFSVPREPFARLLTAFRHDQRVRRYRTHEEVLDYCRNSANPVGRLILFLGRCHDERHWQLADSICTGLQLANFCQDVARDWAKDRIYLPQQTLDRFGCARDVFARGHASAAFRRAMELEVGRAETYLRAGEPLVELMPEELRIDVALFVAGGLSILQAIRDVDYDVWRKRPTISRRRQLRLLLQSWWRTRRFARREAPP